MKEKGYDVTGTFRVNKIPRNCPLSDQRVMIKKVEVH